MQAASQASAPQILANQHIPEEVITLDFVLLLILGAAEEVESRSLLIHLVRRSFRGILRLVQEFAGHPDLSDDAAGRNFQSCPTYADALIELLSYSLNKAARSSIIGVPSCLHLTRHGALLCSGTWWSKDAPSLPLDLLTLWARSLAWHIFWLVVHDTEQ